MTDKNKPAPRSQMWCDNPGNRNQAHLGLVRRPFAGFM